MAPHSGTLAWKIPWTEEPGRLQSMGSLGVRPDWATSLSLFTFMHWRRKWQPTPVFLPGESQGQGTWWAAAYRVAQSQTRLKWLSSSSSRQNLMLVIYFLSATPLFNVFLKIKIWLANFLVVHLFSILLMSSLFSLFPSCAYLIRSLIMSLFPFKYTHFRE